LARYVSALGKKIGALSHQPKLAHPIQVLDSPVVNAFAVPGRQALQKFDQPEAQWEALAIVNGMKLDDAIPGDTIIKVIVK
jgi:hypothetical protein